MILPAPHQIIAIDGPAASGKSSVARELARRLDFIYVNSGAMYRAITWLVLERGIAADDSAAIEKLVETMPVTYDLHEGESRILIEGTDPSRFLRQDRVNQNVSLVSSVRRVREILVAHLRKYGAEYDVVMEGRDIGSVVFPDTTFKFYIDASSDVRLRRRVAQGHRDEIAARDRVDSSRGASPLIIAEGANLIDTSNLTIDAVVDEIIAEALKAPARQIADNAGEDGEVVVAQILENKNAAYGYNAATGEYVDMFKAGIIDPTKVVRLALQGAASVAGLLVTTEAMVADKVDEGTSSTPGGMGGAL
jgi:cytidylate kinase